jgi:two-component system, sensor histidine kinase
VKENRNPLESLTEHLAWINRSAMITAILILTVVVIISNLISGVLTRIDTSKSIAKVLTDSVGAVVVFRDVPAATELLTSFRNSDDVLGATIYTTAGARFAEYITAGANAPHLLPIAANRTAWHPFYIEITQSLTHEGQNVGTLYIQVELISLYVELGGKLLVIWGAAALGLVVARRRSRHLSQQALAPLSELTALMAKVSDEADFSVRAGTPHLQELRTLAQGFNAMLEEVHVRDMRLLEQQESLEETVALRTGALQKAVKEASAANQAKSDFLATMSHEIRTPMNGVLGMAELLIGSNIGEEERQLAQIIHQSGSHLLEIINDILDFSKIESGHMKLEQIEFDLQRLVDDILILFKQTANRKNLRLISNIRPASFNQHVMGDPLRLRQILTNLLGNALKFTSQGEVRLEVWVEANGEDQANFRFCVADSGIGISPAAQAHIFDHFSQADGSTTRRFGGTGLGLAICKRLVELMGGQIWVESAVGEGTKFWVAVELPTLKQASGLLAIAADSDPTLTPQTFGDINAINTTKRDQAQRPKSLQGKVLLAEDNAVNQRLAKAMLAKLGLDLEIANNGAEAVALATSKQFDLILMDCQMPVMDGFQACKQIRELMRQSSIHVPIVALTANAMDSDRERCLAAGMDDYMSKPYGLSQVEITLRRWLPSTTTVIADNALNPIEASKHTVHTEKLLNRDIIDQLHAIDPKGSNKLVTELIRAFMTSSATLLAKLEVALAVQDSESVYLTANSLKASAAHIGAERLSSSFHLFEAYGRRNQLAAANKLLPDLHECFRYSMTELSNILEEYSDSVSEQ